MENAEDRAGLGGEGGYWLLEVCCACKEGAGGERKILDGAFAGFRKALYTRRVLRRKIEGCEQLSAVFSGEHDARTLERGSRFEWQREIVIFREMGALHAVDQAAPGSDRREALGQVDYMRNDANGQPTSFQARQPRRLASFWRMGPPHRGETSGEP